MKKKILMVDDDLDFVAAVAFALEADHYAVFKAHNGRDAVRLARTEHPDLILMDIMMGERTEGLFTVQELRRAAELKEVPIFVVSALYTKVPDFGVLPAVAWMAHDEFFPKPVDTALLLGKIRERLAAPKKKEAAS